MEVPRDTIPGLHFLKSAHFSKEFAVFPSRCCTFVHTYYMLTLTNNLQIISQGSCVGLQLKPLQFVTILRCWLKMNMEAVDAVESVFSKL